ncbi:MAG: DUF3343 domain-containing protein [Clostridia bacterium]|nr:DUF3343 domain-containing protein [Clostridia bacterium]
MEYIVLSFTQGGAIRYQRFLAFMGIKGKLQPVPRKLSSSCGIAVRLCYHGDLKMLINDDVERIYQLDENVYTLKYQAEN